MNRNGPVAIKFSNDKPHSDNMIYGEYVQMKRIESVGVRNCIRALNYAPKMIVMPYYPMDLHEATLMNRGKGGIPARTALSLIVKVSQCLIDMKDKLSLIHNDIKASNIMVNEDLTEAVVIDLGMMTHINEKDFYHGTLTHHHGFIAKSADDLLTLSLGLLLFFLLTDGSEPPQMARNSINWPILKDLDHHVKGGWAVKEIIRRTLHTNEAKNRYTLRTLHVAFMNCLMPQPTPRYPIRHILADM